MLRHGSLLVASFLMASTAPAANVIEEWGGAAGGYTIYQHLHKVEITAAGTYKFQATDGAALGIIKQITVPSPITGTVIIYIVRDPEDVGGDPHSPGAAEVWEIDLANASDGQATELRTTGNYGHAIYGGPLVADETGTLHIGGDVLDEIDVAGDMSAPLTVGGHLHAPLECDGTADDISLLGTGEHTGNITVGDGATAYDGDVHVGGPHTATLSFRGPFNGTLTADDDLNTVTIDAAMLSSGSVFCAGDVLDEFAVGRSMLGTLCVLGGAESIHIGSQSYPGVYTLNDSISVRGPVTVLSVNAYVAPFAEIEVGGSAEVVRLFEVVDGKVAIGGDLSNKLLFTYGLGDGLVRIDGDVHETALISSQGGDGVFEIGGQMGGFINVNQALSGVLRVKGQMSGTILASGDVTHEASIEVGQTAGAAMTGVLILEANMAGKFEALGDLQDSGGDGSGGQVRVNGPLASTASIAVRGAFATGREFIAVDYNGYHPTHTWEAREIRDSHLFFARAPSTFGGRPGGWRRLPQSRMCRGGVRRVVRRRTPYL